MSEATEHEEYVLSKWEWIVVRKRDDRPEWEWFGALAWQMNPHLADSEAECWSSAYAFTKERDEQIRLVEEEIAVIEADISESWDCRPAQVAYLRIEERLKSALAELRKGMRQ